MGATALPLFSLRLKALAEQLSEEEEERRRKEEEEEEGGGGEEEEEDEESGNQSDRVGWEAGGPGGVETAGPEV